MCTSGLMEKKQEGGAPKDDAQAVSWYRRAAEAGNANAMVNLGFMYETNRGGLPKDEAQAVSWYRKATQLGNTDAQQALERLRVRETKEGQLTGIVHMIEKDTSTFAIVKCNT